MRKAPAARHIMGRHTLLFILLSIMSVALAGCQSPGGTGSQPQPQPSKGDSQGPSLPAVTAPTGTSSPVPSAATMGPLTSGTPGNASAYRTPTTPESQAAGPNAWAQHGRSDADGTRLSYRYPPAWTQDLTYCPAGKNANQGLGSHLPPGCAGTDFLFGAKAKGATSSIKPSESKARSAGGVRVVTQVDTPLDTTKAASAYTVLVYDESGTPLSGFVTYIGPGTSEADRMAILATLDTIAATVTLEK